MSKVKAPRALKDNEAKAVARMLRVSPQKLNLLAQLIRGKKVEKALADLEFSRKRSAFDVRKDPGECDCQRREQPPSGCRRARRLRGFRRQCDGLKRFSARARGRSGRIHKPFANLTIIVREAGAAASQA